MDSKALYICFNEVDDEILERSEKETVDLNRDIYIFKCGNLCVSNFYYTNNFIIFH